MNNDICRLAPMINGEQSQFYNELMTYVGNDRKLANFLYSLSVLESIKNKFDKTLLNAQGEPKIEAFAEKFNVKEMIDYKALLLNDARQLGAIDSKGNPILYTNLDEIVDRVIEYNDTHKNSRARILYKNDNYMINVESLNSENFNTNSMLRYNTARLDVIQGYLSELGFKTDFSEQTKKFFNVLNVNNVYETFSNLSKFDSKKDWYLINRNTVSMFMDMFPDDVFLERIRNANNQDIDTLDVIMLSLNREQLNKYLDSIEDLEERQLVLVNITNIHNLAMNFVKKSASRFKDYSTKEVSERIAEIAQEQEKINEIDVYDIKNTLRDLYRAYHIDIDLMKSIDQNITSLSEASERLINIASNLDSIRSKKQLPDNQLSSEFQLSGNVLYSIEQKHKAGQYVKSIVEIMQHLNTELNQYEARLKRMDKENADNTFPMKRIQQNSTILVLQKRTVESYKDIITMLADINSLEQDGFDITPELLKEISETAKQLESELNILEKQIKEQLFKNVYSFMKIYWGEDKVDQGKSYVLEDMLRVAAYDVSFLDRFAFSMHECSDPVIATLGQAVKEQHQIRDNILRDINEQIRVATDKLYRSGSNTNFMFVINDRGEVVGIQSPYDYVAYENAKKEFESKLKEQKLSKNQYKRAVRQWEFDNLEVSEEFGTLTWVPKNFKNDSFLRGWTEALKEYYNTMMRIKALMTELVGAAAPGIYQAIQLSDSLLGAIDSAHGDPQRLWRLVSDKFKNVFKKREDETDYGVFGDSSLQLVAVNPDGTKVLGLPLFYTNELQDKTRITRDFSRAMMAFCSTSVNYYTMDEISDSLLLTKDLLMNRKIQLTSGLRVIGSIFNVSNKEYVLPAYETASSAAQGKLLEDSFDRFFGKKKNVWEGTLFGKKIQFDKTTDKMIGYTSMVGLTANVLGAEANILVGKLLMLIESGAGLGGEFFGVKDMVFAEAEYWKNIPGILAECTSNNIKNKMSLLAQKFDALEDFYLELSSTGFYKSPISKILGNKSLFFLYGMGEHLLHIEGMLACLNNIKVAKVDENGNITDKKTLYDIFKVEMDSNTKNGKIVLEQGYKYLNRKGEVVGDINDEYIAKIKKRISYVNKTMHGGFGEDDKSTAHKYAIGRLFWNFRQWMPEHYARRFRGRYYNAELGEFREGYYTTAYRFIRDCVLGLKDKKLMIATRWNELSEMEQYNLKRAISETTLLALTTGLITLAATDDKDLKKNWAYKNFLYELKRVQMETRASTIIQKNPFAFVNNMLGIMNLPFALIKTVQSLGNLFKWSDWFVTIENGKYKGENKYLHTAKKTIPIYGQIVKWYEFDEGMFSIFDD